MTSVYKIPFPMPADKGRGSLDPALVADRLAGLGKFLTELLAIPEIYTDKDVRAFLSTKLLVGEEANPGRLEKLKKAFGGKKEDEEARRRRLAFVERDEKETLDDEAEAKKERDLVFGRQKSYLAKELSNKWASGGGSLKSKQGVWSFKEGVMKLKDSKSFPKGLTFFFDEPSGTVRSAAANEDCKYGYGEWDGSTMIWRQPTNPSMVYQFIWWSPENRFFFDRYLHGPSQWVIQSKKRIVPSGGDTTYATSWDIEGKIPPVFLITACMLRYVKAQI